MSEAENDKLKTIEELLKYTFFIPSYQRGYRWDTGQVFSLLTDIEEFGNKEKKNRNKFEESFYCLQPLVLKKIEESADNYELIDGQQRATTIYLILSYFNNKTYRLFYKTRDDDESGVNAFLKELPSLEIPSYSFINEPSDYNEFDNIISLHWKDKIVKNDQIFNTVDNFYLYRTYSVIKNWFSKFGDAEKIGFLELLLKKTKVIWYVEDQNSLAKQSIKKFINFNEGQIELEQSELIKALFVLDLKNITNLIQRQYEENQFADEWNQIEHQMGDDKFWQFVSNSKSDEKIANKINLLFQLVDAKRFGGFGNPEDRFYNYRRFAKAFNPENEDKKPQWQDIVGLYNSLEEWYFDRTSFHLVGTIIHLTDHNISQVVEDAKNSDNKIQFRNALRSRIKSFFKKDDLWKNKFDLNEIEYNDSGVFKLLLLYNIALTQIDEVDSFFPFYRFYNVNSWNKEHILAKKDDGFDSFEEFTNFNKEITELIDSLKDKEISTENRSVINDLRDRLKEDIVNNNKSECKKIIKEINEKLSEFLNIDDFSNLCLLDQSTNIKVGKNPFRKKRNIILKLAEDIKLNPNAYIPIGTKYVFSKNSTPSDYYQVDYWSQKDRDYYVAKIESTVNQFLKDEDDGRQ